jgi:anti-sigma regulatory factor (Ser/Thr protein kinase)
VEHQQRAHPSARPEQELERSPALGPKEERQPVTDDAVVLRYAFWATPESPGEARARTAAALAGDARVDDALVLVSELVTNAILHTSREAELRVLRPTGRDTIRVEVRDHDPVPPQPSESAGAHGGYGLRIVAAVADRWGHTVVADGKIVWFELDGNGAPSE